MKKLTLTSVATILIATPAMAAVGDKTFTPGTMENPGMCVADTTGVSSGTAQTNANWSTNTYTCAAGTYLPDGDTWTSDSQGCTQCPANSYCAGNTYQYSDASDQGITACPSGYTLSDAGSDAASDCYRNCASGDVAHLKDNGTMTGRYYSNATNTCEPSDSNQCANGYHYVAGFDPTTISTTVGQGEASGYGYKSILGTGINHNAINLENGEFYVDYGTGHGVIKGHGRCSTRGVNNVWSSNNNTFESDHFVTNLTDETGQQGAQYCYCQLDSYTLDDGSMQSLSAPWVFNYDYGYADDCAMLCADYCAIYLWGTNAGNLAFRAAVFGSIQSSPASCQANEISIQWSNGDGTSQSGTCTYDTAIETPATGPTKRGHTFTGWTFVAQP